MTPLFLTRFQSASFNAEDFSSHKEMETFLASLKLFSGPEITSSLHFTFSLVALGCNGSRPLGPPSLTSSSPSNNASRRKNIQNSDTSDKNRATKNVKYFSG